MISYNELYLKHMRKSRLRLSVLHDFYLDLSTGFQMFDLKFIDIIVKKKKTYIINLQNDCIRTEK